MRAHKVIFVAGHVAIDEIIDSSCVAPREALGGSLCYSTICLNSLGYESQIITRVGRDFPKDCAEFLAVNARIDIEGFRVQDFKTTRYRIDRSERDRKLWLISKCRGLKMEDFVRATTKLKSSTRVLIMNPIAGEVSLSLLARVLKRFDRVFLDSQGFVRKFNKKTGRVTMKSGLDISFLSGVEVLKTDCEELFAWTGISEKERAIANLSKQVSVILLTSGAESVELYEQGTMRLKVRPVQVKVKDTTGAGDIMLTSFVARYLEGGDLKDALQFAVAAGSLSVSTIGIKKALLSKNRVLQEMKNVKITA